MITRTEATFGLKPDWLVADTAYGSGPNLHFLVDEKSITPHIPVIDKSQATTERSAARTLLTTKSAIVISASTARFYRARAGHVDHVAMT
jgi:hypothetical protein